MVSELPTAGIPFDKLGAVGANRVTGQVALVRNPIVTVSHALRIGLSGLLNKTLLAASRLYPLALRSRISQETNKDKHLHPMGPNTTPPGLLTTNVKDYK